MASILRLDVTRWTPRRLGRHASRRYLSTRTVLPRARSPASRLTAPGARSACGGYSPQRVASRAAHWRGVPAVTGAGLVSGGVARTTRCGRLSRDEPKFVRQRESLA